MALGRRPIAISEKARTIVDVTPMTPAGRQVVEAYGGGGFRVGGAAYKGSVLVFPDRTLAWPVGDIAEMTLENLEAALAGAEGLEILLVGCGARAAFIPPALRKAVRAAGPVLEAMDTGAACRTYNVLLSEERRVGAALIAVD